MNSAKRKQKDAKNREIFDKAFPEMKKIREDQGQKDGGKGEDGHGTLIGASTIVWSDHLILRFKALVQWNDL